MVAGQGATGRRGAVPEGRGFLLILSVLVAAVFLHLAWRTGQRVVYPWDFYLWSESPFLTNLIKISQGSSPYTSPGDANSFVYSTGLEWLTYALLQPFGLALDIRYGRLVSIGFGLLGCGLGAAAIARLVAMTVPGAARGSLPLHFGVLVLVLFTNFTADVVHPDNLHVCHALVTFWLGLLALDSGRIRWAVAALAWAGLGVLTKQTEALAFGGLSLAFFWCGPWTLRTRLLLPLVGLLSCGLALGVLWWSPYARTYTLDLLLQHPIDPAKLRGLLQDLAVPHRALLLVLALPALRYLHGLSVQGRRYVVLWLCTAAFSVAPNLSAYFKVMGAWNNLGILDVWLALAVWPAVYLVATGASSLATLFQWLGRATAIALVLTLVTRHAPPPAAYYAAAARLEDLLRADHAAGRTVLVAHGTSVLVRAGFTGEPLDRANSVLELTVANAADRAGTLDRIREGYYDRIYLNSSWYGGQIEDAIRNHYVRRDVLPGTGQFDYPRGFQGLLMDGCQVWERRGGGGTAAVPSS